LVVLVVLVVVVFLGDLVVVVFLGDLFSSYQYWCWKQGHHPTLGGRGLP
jgi:hypothetical protein